VENGLLTSYDDPSWKGMNLEERMAYYNVPGVSIAVINDFQVEWAKGYGVMEAGKNQPVTPETLFQTASIAKVVVAVMALNQVEKGVLGLDEDVNENLVSWQIPDNEFLTEEKVTLRRLLSHQAGVTIEGFVGYRQGESIPDLLQILDGKPPANSVPIRVDAIPGSLYRYSGGGYMIIQQLMEDMTGLPFDELARQIVFEPWGMSTSTMETPLPEEFITLAASGHRADGNPIPGGWHNYPEAGAGASMWSTPTDLAQFAIKIMEAYEGRPDEVLSQEMTRAMLTRQIEDRGLGPLVYDEGGDRFYFMHSGANDGYKTFFAAYPERGQGMVIMTNSDKGDALYDEIKRSISVEYGLISGFIMLYAGIIIMVAIIIVTAVYLYRRRVKRRKKLG